MRSTLPADLCRPHRLLTGVRPWSALLYAVLETVAGWVTLLCAGTIVLLPLWLLVWPRCERRLVMLAGHPSPGARPGRGLRWRDFALVALTVFPAVVGLAGLVCLGALVLAPFGPLVRLMAEPGTVSAGEAARAASLGLLGLLVLALALWSVSAASSGWAALSGALLSGDEERLARQVEALGAQGARTQDALLLERRQLERDLHDGAQMHLGAAGMRLALLRLDVDALPEGPARGEVLAGIAEVTDRLEDASAAVRRAAAGLVPPSMRDGGLCAVLPEMAAALPVPVRLECSLPRLAPVTETGLHLVAAEALANVTRHAGAASVGISARIDEGEVCLEIEDDGCGGARPTGTGLVSMRSRARLLGGDLHLVSGEGTGTRVTVRVPARAPDGARLGS